MVFSPTEISLFLVVGLLLLNIVVDVHHYSKCHCERCMKKRHHNK